MINRIKQDILNNNYRIVYTTPEYIITQPDFIKQLEDVLIMVAIDESHCVSTWGNDFRESYKSLGIIKQCLENVPIVALTATATEKVKMVGSNENWLKKDKKKD